MAHDLIGKVRYWREAVLHRTARRLFGAQSLAEIAEDCVEVCPAEERIDPPAIYLPSELDKIVSLAPMGSSDAFKTGVFGGRVVHAATRAYRIKDATIRRYGAYKKQWFHAFPDDRPYCDRATVWTGHKSAALVSSWVGLKFFGHWLTDDAARYPLAAQFGAPLTLRVPNWRDVATYREIFNQDWTPYDCGRFKELIVFEDFGQNEHRRRRLQNLREAVSRRVKPRNKGGFIYLRRGDTGATPRLVENEVALVGQLSEAGFSIIDVAENTTQEIVEAIQGAKLVVSVEGSQLAHAMPGISETGAILAIMPPTLATTVHADWAKLLGVQFGFVVGKQSGNAAFEVDIDSVMKTVELFKL